MSSIELNTFTTKSKIGLDDSGNKLSPTLAIILASVLDDAIDQLYILGAGLVPKKIICLENIETKAAQYVANDPIFDRETGDTFEESFNKKKLLKLYFDSSKICELLTQIKTELRFDRDFQGLLQFLEHVRAEKEEEKQLFQEEGQNFDAMNNLKQSLFNEQRDSSEKLRELKEELAVLRDEAEDVLFENIIKTRYIKNWQQARNEQNDLSCFLKENELETIINKYKSEIDKETRVNSEIEMYIHENQKDMEELIDQWMTRYEKDSESRIVEIAVLKEKREDLQVEYDALKDLYDSHQQDIDEYLMYKELKRQEQERFDTETAAAIKIQAWWRGLMVRRQLGPFNPNIKKKGKGKDDKNKKDKKGKKK